MIDHHFSLCTISEMAIKLNCHRRCFHTLFKGEVEYGITFLSNQARDEHCQTVTNPDWDIGVVVIKLSLQYELCFGRWKIHVDHYAHSCSFVTLGGTSRGACGLEYFIMFMILGRKLTWKSLWLPVHSRYVTCQ